MIRPVWKVISLILALGVFLAVGIANFLGGEELVWLVGKAVAAFFVSWIILNHLGAMLLALFEKQDEQAMSPETGSTERGS